MMPVLVAFDCEATGLGPEDTLTCIVAIKINANKTKTTHEFYVGPGESLSTNKADAFIDWLWEQYTHHKACILSFNGIGFDFKKLRELVSASHVEKLELLALGSVDIMLDFATEHGYFAGMQSFAEGCGFAGKTQTGAWAAEMWKTDHTAVLAYCQADVDVLLKIWAFRVANNRLYRATKAGKRVLWMPQAPVFRPVHVCITAFQENPVVPAWMKDPPAISALWEWL
jgi:hypothetical protein